MKINTILLFILITSTCYSQKAHEKDSIKIQPKNVIYVCGGNFVIWFAASVNYERQIFSTNKKVNSNYYIRACYGRYSSYEAGGHFGSLSLQGVFGSKKKHLELGIGTAGLYNRLEYQYHVNNTMYYRFKKPDTRLDYTKIIPAASIGYRKQKPGSGFVFRTGIGFPDGLYISFGGAF